MEKYFFLTIIFSFVVVSCSLTTFGKDPPRTTTVQTPIDSDTDGPTNKTYHLQTTFTATWHKAVHHCIHKRMRIASIFSQSEFNQLEKQINESGYTDGFWIALTKLGGGSNFYWFGYDKPVTFWQKTHLRQEVGNSDANCALIDESRTSWNRIALANCDTQLHFVCESDIPS